MVRLDRLFDYIRPVCWSDGLGGPSEKGGQNQAACQHQPAIIRANTIHLNQSRNWALLLLLLLLLLFLLPLLQLFLLLLLLFLLPLHKLFLLLLLLFSSPFCSSSFFFFLFQPSLEMISRRRKGAVRGMKGGGDETEGRW